VEDHPFLEQILNHLGVLYKVTGSYSKAILVYGNLIKSKEKYYGKNSENLITPLKNLGMCLSQMGEVVEARKITERAILIG